MLEPLGGQEKKITREVLLLFGALFVGCVGQFIGGMKGRFGPASDKATECPLCEGRPTLASTPPGAARIPRGGSAKC
jgi:hypothetical protein